MGLAQIGIAIPNFWFAILLILLFSVKLQWFSAGGFPGWEDGRWPRSGAAAACRCAGRGAGRHPGAHHALGGAGGAARGLCAHRPRQGPEPARHAVGPCAAQRHDPGLTVMGLQFANLLAGTIVVENVFYLPGLGRLIFQSIANRDLIVVRNCVMLLAAMVVVVNFVVDVLYAVIDPRQGQRHMSALPTPSAAPAAPSGRRASGPRPQHRSFVLGGVLTALLILAPRCPLSGRPGRPTRWTWPQAAAPSGRTGWAPTPSGATWPRCCWWARAARSRWA
jgi:hypothetical protein